MNVCNDENVLWCHGGRGKLVLFSPLPLLWPLQRSVRCAPSFRSTDRETATSASEVGMVGSARRPAHRREAMVPGGEGREGSARLAAPACSGPQSSPDIASVHAWRSSARVARSRRLLSFARADAPRNLNAPSESVVIVVVVKKKKKKERNQSRRVDQCEMRPAMP